MKRFLYILPIIMFFSACQKEVAPQPERNDFAEVEESVIEHVNIPLKDEQISKLFSAVEFIRPDTRSEVYQNDDIQELLQRDGLVVIMFGASWCLQCQIYLPSFINYAIACEYTDVAFAYYNIDAVDIDIVTEYKIQSVPTTIFIKNNDVEARVVGIPEDEDLDALVVQYH